MVDGCKKATIVESEHTQHSTEDRRACEVQGATPGENKYLNLNTPLQLGGIADSSIGALQMALPAEVFGFNGCIKNLIHNGEVGPK